MREMNVELSPVGCHITLINNTGTHTAHVMQAHIRDDNQTKYVIAKS